MDIVQPTQAEIDAYEAEENVKNTDLFANPKRGAKAQAWVNFLFVKDPTLYADQLAYWKAVRLAYRDRPWRV